MDALLFALALENSLLQIHILEGSFKLRLRLHEQAPSDQRLKYDKLVTDREMVKNVLRNSLLEVAEHGQWCSLQQAGDQLAQRALAAQSMRTAHEELCRTRETIVNKLKSKRKQWTTEHFNTDQKIAYLKDQIKNEHFNSRARLSYAEKWLAARIESLELQFQAPPAKLPNIDHEQRVHESLLKAYDLQTKDREESLEYWKKRYASDTTDINDRLVTKRDQLLVIKKRKEELQKLYDLHEGEIRGWLTFKRERAARLEREEQRRKAATRIQAWWRAVMVRRCLGQFRALLRNSTKKQPNKTKKK